MARALPLLALLLTSCVQAGPFPSLAPREGEELAIEEPVREAAPVPDDPGVTAFITARTAEAQVGARAFDRLYADTERTAARAGPEGSDSWVEAQQALSRLEAARMNTSDTLAGLHWLQLERAQQPTSEADQRAIEEAIAEVARLAADQQARIERIRR
jgi:hypothetical protein